MTEQMRFASKNVEIGEGSIIEPGVLLGVVPQGKADEGLVTKIGRNCYLRSNTVIYAGVTIGDDFQTGHNVVVRERNQIGSGVCIWTNTILNPGNTVGNHTRIHAGCFLEDVSLGEYVFIGPGVIFANDPHPTNPPQRTCLKGAVVGENAVLGANVTVLPHVAIGKRAVVGAGAVVVKDVPEAKVVVGNPAQIIKNVEEVHCRKEGKDHFPYKIDEV